MSGCSDNKNPLQRSGTSQQQRLLPGLQKNYVLVDERDFSDWIFFASELSKFINYFDANNNAVNDWSPFFSSDVSASLSIAAIQNVEEYRLQIKERFDFLKDEANSVNTNKVEEQLTELFAALLSLSQAIDLYEKKLPQNISLKNNIQNLIKVKLASSLRRLLSYYKGANDLGFIQPANFNGWKVFNTEVVDAQDVINTGLSNIWQTNTALAWADYVADANLSKDESIFGDAAWSEFRRINHAANHNLFSSVFDQYLAVFASIVKEAETELLKTLGQWDSHPAHYALFLSFLKLFKFAQSGANTITQRHLDFYYKEVLRLQPKAAEPNSAHILVELAKQVDAYALKEDVLFKAGKDSIGKEVDYALNEEETFNKAKVALLKSVYKGSQDGSDDHAKENAPAVTVNNTGRLLAAPVANSEDGLGAELKSEHKEWHPFVHKVYTEGDLTDIAMPNALIGFAIASHYLYLTEGERVVHIRLATSNNTQLNNIPVDCYLTTEKEWYKIEGNPIFSTGNMTDTTACAQLTFTLPGDAPAIVSYNSEIHGGTFNTTAPVLKIYLRNEDGTIAYPYESLKNITLTKVEVRVEVGMADSGHTQKGLKQLFLSNDFGPLDASKAFLPFGSPPRKDVSIVIGNKEVFTKKNVSIKLHLEWSDLPASATYIDYSRTFSAIQNTNFTYSYFYSEIDPPYYPKVKLNLLSGGVWKGNAEDNSIAGETDIFDFTNPKVTVFSSSQTIPSAYIQSASAEYQPYGITSNKGFMRLVLSGDFGHKKYLEDLTAYLLEKNYTAYQFKSVPFKPYEPYTPNLKSLYLSYSAYYIESINNVDPQLFEDRSIQFFHIYPFGEAEQHQFLSGSGVKLVPQFSRYEGGATIHHVGEFYMGIENLAPQQSIHILFQVMEGTTDPLVEKPDQHVHWSYLSKNKWISFDDQAIGDATRQLVQSGIISFIIPEDATTDNTMLPPGYLWLKASVSEAAEAVCKLLSVHAQAAVVTFRPNENADDFLNSPLPAGTISKLRIPDAAVKKVEQPYTSFGGRAKETEDQFYRRVSERLRHKARAITIWDYEHLVLEAFPQIHKVKCLNHTKIEDGEYNETAPGYVGVITVPNLVNRNDANPLRPYTTQNTLLEIEEYLKKKISCHVKLRVRNPQFEEVRLSFALRLMEGFDDFTFYSKQLKEEITQFLTPWAFTSGADIQFGGKIYKSVLINFIEERPYVDFITNVEMYHRIDEKSNTESGDLDEIMASTARSILVSAPASKHNITEIQPEEEEEDAECLQVNHVDRKR